MAQLKGGSVLWSATSGLGLLQNAVSRWAYVGIGPNVVLFVDGTAASVASTFTIQVSGIATPEAGLNIIDTSQASGGLPWYDLMDTTLAAAINLAVASGQAKAFDLSPFGASFMRLKRTDSNGSSAFTAFVNCFG